MPDSSSVSRETSLAVKVLLARLAELAGLDASARRDPRSVLLAIPDDARQHVVGVLQEILARAAPGSEGLVSGARLLLDAARELWAPDNRDGGRQDSGTH